MLHVGSGEEGNIDVTAEYDQGVFLAIVFDSIEADDHQVEFQATDSQEIEAFFELVERAKQDYFRLKAEYKDK